MQGLPTTLSRQARALWQLPSLGSQSQELHQLPPRADRDALQGEVVTSGMRTGCAMTLHRTTRRAMPIMKLRAKVARLYGYDLSYVKKLSRQACENLIIQAKAGAIP